MSIDALTNGWAKALHIDRKQFNMFIDKMLDGFAYNKIVLDKAGKPVDFVFLEVNRAFERITGQKREKVLGKRVTEVLKGLETDPANWIGVFGRVALEGESIQFEKFAKPLGKWLYVSAYCPERGFFVALLEDITERKKAEEELKLANEELEERVRKRTAEVSSEHQRLFNVLETLPVYVVLLDKDYRVPFANRVFRERFGESHGRRCYEYLFMRDLPCENCETYKVLKTNASHHWEWTGPDGRNYDIYDYPFTEADGSNLILEMGIDITDRKKAEASVLAERKRLFDVLETLPQMICLLTPDYQVAFANRSFRERFGESNGKHCYEYCFGRAEPCDFCETCNVLKTGKPYHWEVTGPEGNVIEVYDFPFTDVDGSPMILEMDIDITERRRAEKQIHAASLYARSLLEASLDPLVTISAEGKITDVNQATESVTGFSRERLIGSDFSDYFTEPEEARKGYQKVFADGFVRDYPLAIRHKSGKIVHVLYNATVYKNEKGEVQGVFAAARDVTELRKAEELAQESARKLKDAERLATIGAIAGMVGHDMRNPLQSITGDIYLAKSDLAALSESQEKANLKESLDEIEKGVEYINKIVMDLQDYAKPITPVAKETDLNLLINDLLKKNSAPEDIKVYTRVYEEVSRIVVDPELLQRILGNLFSNAVQAMPDGGKLTIRAIKEKDGTVITVQDTGVGIPEDVKPKLFTPLFTTKSKGQGFGLAVVKRMTEALGGTISFESEVGKGTKFIVRLPPKK